MNRRRRTRCGSRFGRSGLGLSGRAWARQDCPSAPLRRFAVLTRPARSLYWHLPERHGAIEDAGAGPSLRAPVTFEALPKSNHLSRRGAEDVRRVRYTSTPMTTNRPTQISNPNQMPLSGPGGHPIPAPLAPSSDLEFAAAELLHFRPSRVAGRQMSCLALPANSRSPLSGKVVVSKGTARSWLASFKVDGVQEIAHPHDPSRSKTARGITFVRRLFLTLSSTCPRSTVRTQEPGRWPSYQKCPLR
jgi:hypothetical protein